MRVLCLGNNTSETDQLTTDIAKANNSVNNGLLTDLEDQIEFNNFHEGFYHTSVYDIIPGRIIELAENFDRVYLLDQPKEKWSHPDAFYRTVTIIQKIKNSLVSNSDMLAVPYWEDLVQKNKSFCIFPFIELLVQNGNTTVCCRSREPVTTLDQLVNFNTNESYQMIRNQMLSGDLVNDHCESCYREENKGVKSARQQETVEWANRLNLTTVDDLKNFNGPVYYEVRASNNCNLQCRICSPVFSKLIEEEYIQLGLHDPKTSYDYVNFDFVEVNKVKKLYVAGGEPTAMPEFYKFLRDCITKQTTDFEFLVNTNAHKISKTLLELGRNFSNLQYIVSVDGFKQANEYSRWPSNWDNLVNNVKKLIANGHQVTFNVAVSIYTVFSFVDLVLFLQKEFPNCLIHAQVVYGKQYPFIIDYDSKFIDSFEILKTVPIYNGDALFSSFVDGFIASMLTSTLNKDKLSKFFKFNDLLDQSRSVKLIDYIPKLEAYRNEC